MKNQSPISRRELVAALGLAGGALALPRIASADGPTIPQGGAAVVQVGEGESLAAAVARAVEKSLRLYLSPGEYVVTEAISLPSGCVLSGAGPGTVLRMAKDLKAEGVFVLKDAADVSIRDLVIDGSQANGEQCNGIRGTNLSGFAFENIHFRDRLWRAINIWGKSSGGTIRNCTVHGASDRAIVLGGAEHCTVEGCEAAEGRSHGIWVLGSARHVAVLNNDVHDNRGQGIEVFKGCEDCIVAYNRCARNSLGIHCHTVKRSLLFGNTLENNRSNGIDCNNCEQMRIVGNHSEFNGSPRSEENQVEGSGILLFRSRDSLVVGNVSINNDQGNSLRSGIQLMDEGEEGFLCARNVVVGNICFDDQEKPTQQVGMRIGRSQSKCPDNLVVANSLGRHPQGPFGGNRRGAVNAAHNWSGDFDELHGPAPARSPVVEKLPAATEQWHGRMLLLAAGDRDILHLCRKEEGQLRWVALDL